MTARNIGKHAVWNVMGQVLPIAVAIAVVPVLVARLGLDRYGFLTLVWVLMGYLGVFDFGVGRAMTRLVAERLGAKDPEGADMHAGVALAFLGVVGVVLAAVVALCAPAVVQMLRLPAELVDEGISAVRILAIGMPLVMLTAGYRGWLEAHRAFGVLNIIRVGMGVLTYGAPLLATLLSPRLEVLVLSVVVMRLLANVVHRRCALPLSPARLRLRRPSRQRLQPLLALGGWMTVSNVVSPLMGSVDRLLIGSLVPIAAVGMYATAFDVATKVLILAYSLVGAAFPFFAALQEHARTAQLYASFSKVMLVVVWPVLFTLSLVAEPLFLHWIGPEFVAVAAPATQILALGLYFNCLAQVPAMLIHSRGSPKWMAILHLAEVPVFLLAIYALTMHFGVLGTAAAWTLRAAIDSLLVHALVHRRLARGALDGRHLLFVLLLAPAALGLPLLEWTLVERLVLGGVALSAFPVLVWVQLLDADERALVMSFVQARLGRLAP